MPGRPQGLDVALGLPPQIVRVATQQSARLLALNIREISTAILRHLWISLVLAAAGLSQPVRGQDLIPDPTFSAGVSSWNIENQTRLDWISAAGVDGAAGFARLTTLVAGPAIFFTRVCLPAQAGKTYSYGGFLRTDRRSSALMSVHFYENSSCSNPLSLSSSATLPLYGGDSDPTTWYFRAGPDVVAPPKTTSVAFQVDLISPLDVVSVDFDDVYFGPQGTRAPLGVAIPTISMSVLLLLAISLAAAGFWRLGKG